VRAHDADFGYGQLDGITRNIIGGLLPARNKGLIMELFGAAGTYLSSAAGYLLPFLAVLTVVVFIHELGHFLVGRWCGTEVKVFSIGFGRELFAFTDKHGTRWRFALIPLGGYVRFAGDANGASMPDTAANTNLSPAEKARTLQSRTIGQRAAIVAAGPIANFIMAIVIFAGIAMIYGRPQIAPRVEQVVSGGAAERSGLKSGDLILSINGSAVETFEQVQRVVSSRPLERLAFTIDRDGKVLDFDIVPDLREQTSRLGTQRFGLIGVQASRRQQDVTIKSFGPVDAIGHGFSETWHVVERTGQYLGKLLAGKESADQLSGPIRIAQVSGEIASASGLAGLVTLMAILSVSIGLINLVPIPMLDGGHLLFYFCEWVMGRPLSERAQELGFKFGIGVVLMLTVFVTWNDLMHVSRLLAG
jgi:regulator of sigma E protease